jgi:hypothetical protein
LAALSVIRAGCEAFNINTVKFVLAEKIIFVPFALQKLPGMRQFKPLRFDNRVREKICHDKYLLIFVKG